MFSSGHNVHWKVHNCGVCSAMPTIHLGNGEEGHKRRAGGQRENVIAKDILSEEGYTSLPRRYQKSDALQDPQNNFKKIPCESL